jgi:DNA-binding FrmR family transcriptional regulator
MADTPLRIVEGRALTLAQKKDLLNRLARIEGQLRGVQKLIALAAEPSDCDAVAQQMAAARKALDRSFVQLLSGSLVTQSGDAANIDEAKANAARLAALLDKFA